VAKRHLARRRRLRLRLVGPQLLRRLQRRVPSRRQRAQLARSRRSPHRTGSVNFRSKTRRFRSVTRLSPIISAGRVSYAPFVTPFTLFDHLYSLIYDIDAHDEKIWNRPLLTM